jgi:hypothetical protein
MATPDSRRTAWVGCRGRADDTGGTAVGHATGGNSFAGLHDGDSAAVVAFLDCCVVGAPSRRADMASCLRSLCWTAVGWICGDAVCLAMHRRLAVVRGDMVSARYRIGRRGGGAGRVKMAPVLNRWIRRTPPIRSAKDSPLYLASEHLLSSRQQQSVPFAQECCPGSTNFGSYRVAVQPPRSNLKVNTDRGYRGTHHQSSDHFASSRRISADSAAGRWLRLNVVRLGQA